MNFQVAWNSVDVSLYLNERDGEGFAANLTKMGHLIKLIVIYKIEMRFMQRS
jgi:hypothetical protein